MTGELWRFSPSTADWSGFAISSRYTASAVSCSCCFLWGIWSTDGHASAVGRAIKAKLTRRGHGTYVENDTITSSVAGTLERVNKLISVRPLSTRYVPEVGDLVIGRIVEVAGQRWKVEANARQDAVLMLSSVNLPGGVQRRKVESDSLKMREFLAEGDVSTV